MTGAQITVDDGAVLAALERLITAGRDPSPALKALGEAMVNTTKERLRTTKRSPAGVPWTALSRAYARRKRGPGILEETGELRGSPRWQLDGLAALLVGTNRKHARVHQLGADIRMPERRQSVYHRYNAREREFEARFAPRGRATIEREVSVGAHVIRIPARSFLGVSDADRVSAAEAVEMLLSDAWDGQ